MYSDQPQLLVTAPSPTAARSGGSEGGLKPVTVCDLAWEHGMLVTGHSKGEVCVRVCVCVCVCVSWSFVDPGGRPPVCVCARACACMCMCVCVSHKQALSLPVYSPAGPLSRPTIRT